MTRAVPVADPDAAPGATSPIALRAVFGAVTTTTVAVLPVFLTGGLAVQISRELGFDPAGLGLVVALYFLVSALASLPCGALVERFGSGATSSTRLWLSRSTRHSTVAPSLSAAAS